jgi:hypothetical protein
MPVSITFEYDAPNASWRAEHAVSSSENSLDGLGKLHRTILVAQRGINEYLTARKLVEDAIRPNVNGTKRKAKDEDDELEDDDGDNGEKE